MADVQPLHRSLALCGVGAAILALAVVMGLDAGVSQSLQSGSPAALGWRSNDSRALAIEADRRLMSARTPSDFAATADLSRRVLMQSPLQVSALRDLAVVAVNDGRIDVADRLFGMVVQHDLHDPPSLVWRLDRSLRSRQFPAAFATADILLRQSPDRLASLYPSLSAAAQLRGGDAALAGRLGADPPWRADFLSMFAAKATDPAVVFSVLNQLQDTARKPTPAEEEDYLNRRVREGEFDQAYLDWLQFLPKPALRHVDNIYDGDFLGAPGPTPFNWLLTSDTGGSADMGPAPTADYHRALHIAYDGVSSAEFATELLALAPGDWHLSGVVWTRDGEDAPLTWRMSCADGGEHGVVKMAKRLTGSGWRSFSLDFTAAQSACTGQWLRLVAVPGDHEHRVDVWYANLTLKRRAEGP